MEERNDNFGKCFGKEQMKPQILRQPFHRVPEESVSEEGSSQLSENLAGTQF